MKNTNLLATIVAGITLLCLWLPAKAQHPCQDELFQNSLWSAPGNAVQFIIDDEPFVFPLPSHTVAPAISDYYYEGEEATNAHNAIHDQNGNLKYFIVDQFLYNRDGYTIGQLGSTVGDDPNTGNIKGNSEICIVPDPADCERYYIFTSTHGNYGGNTAYYTLLDASVYNTETSVEVEADVEGTLLLGEGTFGNNCESVVSDLAFLHEDNNDVNEAGHNNYHFAASPLFEWDNSRLVIMMRGNTLFRMRLDDNGIHPINPVLQINVGSSLMVRSELELKLIEPTGQTPFYRAAIGGRDVLTVFELDLSGQLIANSEYTIDLDEPWATDYAYVKGLEFSENGEYLYFTHHITLPSNPDAVQYLDFSDMSISTLDVSPLNQSDFEFSQIELGVDGKLYFAYANGLAALEDSNDPNSTWYPLEISIPDYPLSDAGFPTQDPMKVYLLPDQIDGMNYYDHFLVYEDEECCLHHPPYDAYNATATTSGTWIPGDNPFNPDPDCDVVLISNELRIPSGVTITIQDMRFEFHENARVVIEPGGRLNMNNTLFTYGPCGDRMWLGVEVWGDPQAAQIPLSNQGYLNMSNNSVIEHAYIGALAASRHWTGQVSSVSNGGIIRAFNSRFRNNMVDVWINDYNWNGVTNRCYFSNCDFLTDGLLNNSEVFPSQHAYLRRVNNVQFRNCSFRNTASFADLPIENRGTGLFSFHATFRVVGKNETYESAHDLLPISDNVHQSFYRLNLGVVTLGQPNHHFTVSKMEFQDNKVGIYVLGNSFETITFNNFKVPEVDDNYPAYNYGAYLMNSYLFTVEENHFFGGPEITRIAGLVVDNSCPDDAEDDDNIELENEVYRNRFEDLEIGILVLNDNRDQNSEVGLQARCNEFINNYRSDIFLADFSEWRKNQGALFPEEMLTNNVFSMGVYSCGIPYHDLRISPLYGATQSPNNLTVDYHCFENPPTTIPVMDVLHPDPNCAQDQLIIYSVDGSLDYENHCPSNFTINGGGKYELATVLERQSVAEQNLASAKLVYEATIDGGDTEDIIALLQNTLNEESAYLRDLLLASYPLSREALMAAIDAAESFDPWHLTQVLVANSRLPGDVYLFLKDNEVLSPFFMQFVDDAQQNGNVSLARLLYSEISLRSYEKSQAEREIHRLHLHHPDSVDATAWGSYVNNRPEAYYKLYRIGQHLDLDETSAAQSLLDSLKIHDDKKDWLQFKIDITLADTVTEADYSTAWNHFYNNQPARGEVWGWLTAQGQLDSIPPIPEDMTPRSYLAKTNVQNEKAERFLQAWPNPAKDRVVLTYPKEAEGMGIVQMFNADGRLVHEFNASDAGFQEINITGWPTGLYIAKLIVNGKDFETVKISVVK